MIKMPMSSCFENCEAKDCTTAREEGLPKHREFPEWIWL
jgi:hypothetical protein